MKKQIWVHNGTDYRAMARDVLKAAALAERIGDRHARVGIKPNLVVASPADGGATTHVEVVEGIIDYMRDEGFDNLLVLEGSWVGDRTSTAFSACGYTALSKRTGVPLLDTQRDGHHAVDCKGMRLEICDSALALDFLINVPVMKGHCQTGVTCALKNMKGLIPDSEKRRFHTMGLHKPIAHLNAGLRQGFVLVDAICGDLNFEEGGNPVRCNQVFGCYDPVLCDAYVCSLMGYEVTEVPYIGLAAALGVGSDDAAQAQIIPLASPEGVPMARSSRRVERLTRNVQAQDACSACYANLVYALERMDDAGALGRMPQGICIGQGYRSKSGDVGIGSCASGCARHVKGCPPTATEIVRFLEELI